MSRLKEHYQKKVKPGMQEKFGYSNPMLVPKIEKVTLDIGTGKALKDSKFLDIMSENLRQIAGQQPVKKAAKDSISNFGVREGMTVGLQVTLRKDRMYDFLDKLINVTLPRLRDFSGIKRTSFDGKGNYSMGFKENNVFPEVQGADLSRMHGLGITVTTTAQTNEEGEALLEAMGFPFTKENNE